MYKRNLTHARKTAEKGKGEKWILGKRCDTESCGPRRPWMVLKTQTN